MIPKSRLQEFGFADEDKFPRRLRHHAVTMSLPSALDHGAQPLEVVVDDGLVVPLQKPGTTSGMIIKSDGTMLYIWHRDQKDPRSPLDARFIKEIPYDARIEVSNVMQRAVAADPSLSSIWAKISAAWLEWFPLLTGEGVVLEAGQFDKIAKAWDMIGELTGRLTARDPASSAGELKLKVLVQCDGDFVKGWLGEEILVDEIILSEIHRTGRVKYLLQRLYPRMQEVLRNPVFHPRSTFCLYYGSSSVYMIKLVVVAPADAGEGMINTAGIEFTLSAPGGFSPSLE